MKPEGVVPRALLGEQSVGGLEVGDVGGAEQGDEAVLKRAEAALAFAFGLRVGRDAVAEAEAEQRALELRAVAAGLSVVVWNEATKGPDLFWAGLFPSR